MIVIIGIVVIEVRLIIVPIAARHARILTEPFYVLIAVATAADALVCFFHPVLNQDKLSSNLVVDVL